MLENLIEQYVQKVGFKCYTEIRAQRNIDKRVTILNGNMMANSSGTAVGVSARIYKNGAYGFASSPIYTSESIKEVVGAAEKNALFLHSKKDLGMPPFTAVSAFKQDLMYKRDDNITQKQIIDYLTDLDSYIIKKYPKLASRCVVSPNLVMEKLLVTSEGVVSHSFVPRSIVYVMLTGTDKDGAPVDIFEPFGNYGLFDDIFKNPNERYERIDNLYLQLMEKCEGVFAEAGVKNCILHPDLAGILAHEAVGHTVEADFVLSGSVARSLLNKQVASPIVNLVDFAHTALGKTCPIPVYVDDEGVKAEDVNIIENGILKNYMHNKESALKLNGKPQGNARAYSFSDEPLIRMRNTAILPGKDKLGDMIASIDDGYYFVKTGNGQADATGEFMFGVDFGYEIKKGKIGRAIKSTTISGIAFEMLKTVDMLSNDMSWNCSGMCGKKQPIPVGMGGPAIKCKVNVGGR